MTAYTRLGLTPYCWDTRVTTVRYFSACLFWKFATMGNFTKSAVFLPSCISTVRLEVRAIAASAKASASAGVVTARPVESTTSPWR